jgi:hypothetical protein
VTLHEPYAYLYVGDYSADTLDLAAREHRALRLLLLETWVRGPVGHGRLAQVAGLTHAEWQEVKPAVLPLLRAVQPRIAQSLKNIRAYDGQRLPADDWHIVRTIVWERDGRACVYCGATQALEGDHIVPEPGRLQCPDQSGDGVPSVQSVEGIEHAGRMARSPGGGGSYEGRDSPTHASIRSKARAIVSCKSSSGFFFPNSSFATTGCPPDLTQQK